MTNVTAKLLDILITSNVKFNEDLFLSTMQGLVTSLYLKRSHLVYLRDVETLWTRRGFGGMWGNKGAVSIRLVLHGCSLCIVNCHLTPHDHMLKERISGNKSSDCKVY